MKVPEIPEIPTDNLYKFMAIFGLVLIIASFIPSYFWYKWSIDEIRLNREAEKFKERAREIMKKEHDAIVQEFKNKCFSSFLIQVFWNPDVCFDPESLNKCDEIVKSKNFNNYLEFMIEHARRAKEAMKANYRPFREILPIEVPLEGKVSSLEGEALASFCKKVKENAKYIFHADIAERFNGLEGKAAISYLGELRNRDKAVLRDDVKSIYEILEKEFTRVCLKEVIPDGVTFLEYTPIEAKGEAYNALRESQIQLAFEERVSETNRMVRLNLRLEIWVVRLFGIMISFMGFYLWYMKLQRHEDAIIEKKTRLEKK